MKEEEYVKILNVAGKEIQLGLNDYGQCYFIEWVNDKGEKQSTGLGAYNFHYLEDIYYLFDPEYKALVKKEIRGEYMTASEYDKWLNYHRIFRAEYRSANNLTKDLDVQLLGIVCDEVKKEKTAQFKEIIR